MHLPPVLSLTLAVLPLFDQRHAAMALSANLFSTAVTVEPAARLLHFPSTSPRARTGSEGFRRIVSDAGTSPAAFADSKGPRIPPNTPPANQYNIYKKHYFPKGFPGYLDTKAANAGFHSLGLKHMRWGLTDEELRGPFNRFMSVLRTTENPDEAQKAGIAEIEDIFWKKKDHVRRANAIAQKAFESKLIPGPLSDDLIVRAAAGAHALDSAEVRSEWRRQILEWHDQGTPGAQDVVDRFARSYNSELERRQRDFERDRASKHPLTWLFPPWTS